MNNIELKNYVLANPDLVSMKLAGKGLFVLKYKKKVFFDNLWNEYLEECRGTIVDENFNIVQYPFTKIYNYGVEAKAPTITDDEVVTAYRKVNGFMAAMTWYNNDILISTTGSTDSDYVKYIRDMIGNNYYCYAHVLMKYSEYTFLFECVHPDDPHIVPEEAGLYLLGARFKQFGSAINNGLWANEASKHMGCKLPEVITDTFVNIKQMAKECKHEGFVVYTIDGRSTKIKSPYYLTNKFVARCQNTQKLMRKDIKNNLDEEYYPLIDAIQADIETFAAKDEQERLVWCREFLEKQNG